MTERRKVVTKVMITTLLRRTYCLENSALKMRAEYSLVAFLFPLKHKVFIIQKNTIYTFIAMENKVFPVDTTKPCVRIYGVISIISNFGA
jgi:hypothetical protein